MARVDMKWGGVYGSGSKEGRESGGGNIAAEQRSGGPATQPGMTLCAVDAETTIKLGRYTFVFGLIFDKTIPSSRRFAKLRPNLLLLCPTSILTLIIGVPKLCWVQRSEIKEMKIVLLLLSKNSVDWKEESRTEIHRVATIMNTIGEFDKKLVHKLDFSFRVKWASRVESAFSL